MQYPDSYKEANSSKQCASLENTYGTILHDNKSNAQLQTVDVSLLLPAMCFWTYLVLSTVSAGLLCPSLPFYSSRKHTHQANKRVQHGWFSITLGH